MFGPSLLICKYGPTGFETIQCRFNYRLYLGGRSEDEVFMALTQKCRYNIRVAMKHGVEIKVVGKEYLDEFMRIMKTTGERDGFNIRPKEYFERMLDSLGEHCRLYMGFYQGQRRVVDALVDDPRIEVSTLTLDELYN